MPKLKPSPYASLNEVPRLALADLAATIPEDQHLMRKFTPASMIAPRYGEDFLVELFRANEASQDLLARAGVHPDFTGGFPGLKHDAYSHMFDYLPTIIGKPALGGHYMPKVSKGGVSHQNTRKFLEAYPWLEGLAYVNIFGKGKEKAPEAKTADARAAHWGPSHMITNSLDPNRPVNSPEDVIEHEGTHHAMQPHYANRRDMWGYDSRNMPKDVKEIGELEVPVPSRKNPDGSVTMVLDHPKVKDIHESWPHEFMGSLGRLQRETFQATRRRVGVDPKTGEPRAGEFKALVLSGKTPEYLSQEGQRILTYSRNVLKSIEKSGRPFKGETKTWQKAKKAKAERLKKTFFDRIDQLLPTLVGSDQTLSKQLG